MTRERRQVTAVVLAACGALSACDLEVDPDDLATASAPSVEMLFNSAGTRPENLRDPELDDMLIQLLDRAQNTIDFAVMGFGRQEIIDALVRAHERGVRLRMVGDARYNEARTPGYLVMDALGVPMMVGNQYHIMHDKFFIVDGRWVLTGTGNITPTDIERSDNNFVFIDSVQVAADFTAEFEQMLSGRFGAAKQRIDNGNTYEVGDTTVEVYFSPQEDAMGRILESIESAQRSIHFVIFAFTKDQVGSALIERHLAFTRYNRCCDPAGPPLDDTERAQCDAQVECEEPFEPREVRGVVDRSQLHGNGPYHEAYRLILYGVPIRIDGNESTVQPGDYQAGGGRLHSKTMVIDAGTPDAVVLTGSFNWSASATTANDETFFVLHGERVAGQVDAFVEGIWGRGRPPGGDHAGEGGTVAAGDVVFNEVHWDGYNGDADRADFGGDAVYNDEFVELLNTTGRAIDLSMWVIGTGEDFTVGLYPGTVIGPYERFLIVDHNVEPFDDIQPQLGRSAFQDPDFVMNVANDTRFLRLNLHNADLLLQLVDPRGNEIDVAGDGGPPFAGGRQTGDDGAVRVYSMERVHAQCDGTTEGCDALGPGDVASSWRTCGAEAGGAHVREAYRDIVIATPGEANSGGEAFPEEDPAWRRRP